MATPSFMQKSFSDTYDEFLFACSHGDYLCVERLLLDGSITDTDISRSMGQQKRSPIVVAIEHNQLEVIKILLDHLPYSDFREALLLAIYLDLTKIAQLIMEHETFRCFYGTFADWEKDTVDTHDESHFSATEPIQLAAQYNRTRILYNFLKRVPHDVECKCNECKLAGLNDSLRYSQLRLSAYRGLSSNVYLALVSQDPLANAFNICHDLSKLIKNEANFRSEYLSLFNQVSHFTARLLDSIRNQVELELLLTVERLNSAIEHNQQEFIIHTHTQQRLTEIWYQNIDVGRSYTLKKRILASIYYFIIYIPMYIGYFWLPFYFEHQCRWYFQQAAIQALLHSITYEIFLLILILSSIITSSNISLKTEYPQVFDYCKRLFSIKEETIYCQKTIISYFKIFVLIWMAGYVYRNVKKMIRQRRCLEIMDLFMTILFLLYFFLFIAAAIQVHFEWKSIITIEKWERFELLHNESQSANEYIEMRYKFEKNCILLRRNHHSGRIDIEMITEGISTLIIVCCIIHLCFFLVVNEYVGPLLLSLITMSKTIYRWFIFIFIFLFAYQTSFLHLLSYYFINKSYGPDNYYFNTANNIIRVANISNTFGSLKRVTVNVFFVFFGIVKNELTQTYGNSNGNNTIHSASHIRYYFLNSFTSTIGSLIYGSFAFGAKIILITMIIAYIKRLYNLNKQQALNDWKFARAKLYMTFISKDPDTLPVPFNLIPTPRHIMKFFQKNSSIKKNRRNISSQNKYLRKLDSLPNQDNFQKKPTIDDVMNSIVLRFLTEYHPFDIHSSKRSRQIQYKEELSEIRHNILDEIETIQQANTILNKQISTVFFELDKH